MPASMTGLIIKNCENSPLMYAYASCWFKCGLIFTAKAQSHLAIEAHTGAQALVKKRP